MLDEKYISKRIKQLCEKKNMSIYALSQKTGISQSSFSNIARRGSIPNFYTLDRICEGLGVSLAQFFTVDDEKPDLTYEQKMILNVWDSLSEKEKEAVKIYVRGIKLK